MTTNTKCPRPRLAGRGNKVKTSSLAAARILWCRGGCIKKGPGADSEEKHELVSDIDTAVVDSLKGSG